MKTRIFVFVVSLVLALGSNTVRSATIIWTNLTGSYWNTAANWSANQAPASGDDAVITSSGNYTVSLDVSATVSTGIIRRGGKTSEPQ